MPKYTITIADTDLYINTEESPEMVEKLVETVDGRLRSILAMSPRLSKSAAAILCAVDYCAAKIKGESGTKAMEKELKKLTSELEKLKASYAALAAEADEVRRENRIMNDLISKNLSAAPAITAGEQLMIENEAPAAVESAEAAETVPATDVMFDEEAATADTPIEEVPAAPKKRRTRTKSTTSKNKVGDMFDMLTFKDV
jgi:cell division protein ZapA (FtsZ GTPase activity inhibitor)